MTTPTDLDLTPRKGSDKLLAEQGAWDKVLEEKSHIEHDLAEEEVMVATSPPDDDGEVTEV